jgi:hypothetical protein
MGRTIVVLIVGIDFLFGVFTAIGIDVTNRHDLHLRLSEKLSNQPLGTLPHSNEAHIHLSVCLCTPDI